ncbi:hypothetical protein [Streptomyces sp. 6N223]|uniref:hypothetical protein n=1 Tax=Streptomyces sp. 6N223 TaxID=3457412 RepID=UPI003FD0FC69
MRDKEIRKKSRDARRAFGGELLRLELLSPDGSVVAAFLTLMPREMWQGMTDGHGLLWITGDLPNHCYAIRPGTPAPLLALTPAPIASTTAPRGSDGTVLTPVVREAQSSAIGEPSG